MKKVLTTVVLVVFSVAAASNVIQLESQSPFTTDGISRQALPRVALCIEASGLRASWTSHTKNLPSAIAVAEGRFHYCELSSFRNSFGNNKTLLGGTAGRAVPSDRAPPALLALHQ